MNEETPPPAPPIDDRRLMLAIVEAAEGLASLGLATLAAGQMAREGRLGRARVSLDASVHRINLLLGNTLPPVDGPQVMRTLDPELKRPPAAPPPDLPEPMTSQEALARLQREGGL